MTNTKNTGKAAAKTGLRTTTGHGAAPSAPPPAPGRARSAAKTAAKAAPRAAAKPVEASAESHSKPKARLVRDSFTIPKAEYAILEGLKARSTQLTEPAKKSELLRAGIAALRAMDDETFLSALRGVASLKTGRPKGTEASAKSAK